MHKPHRPTAWLWKLFFAFVFLGGAASYFFYLDRSDPGARTAMSVSITLTVIGAGLSFIIATSGWWLRR